MKQYMEQSRSKDRASANDAALSLPSFAHSRRFDGELAVPSDPDLRIGSTFRLIVRSTSWYGHFDNCTLSETLNEGGTLHSVRTQHSQWNNFGQDSDLGRLRVLRTRSQQPWNVAAHRQRGGGCAERQLQEETVVGLAP